MMISGSKRVDRTTRHYDIAEQVLSVQEKKEKHAHNFQNA